MSEESIVRQVLLNNGDEILCEVMQWGEDIIVVKSAVKLHEVEIVEEDLRVFSFRPFMSYTQDVHSEVTINPFAVVSVYIPDNLLLDQYYEGLEQIVEIQNELYADEAVKKPVHVDGIKSNVVSLTPKDKS